MNNHDYGKLKAVAASIKKDARDIDDAIEMTRKAILYLAHLVHDEGKGLVYGTPDQFQYVFLDAAAKFSGNEQSQPSLKNGYSDLGVEICLRHKKQNRINVCNPVVFSSNSGVARATFAHSEGKQ